MFSPNCLFSDLGYKPFSFKLLLTKFVLIINSQLTFKFTFVKLIIPPNCEKSTAMFSAAGLLPPH